MKILGSTTQRSVLRNLRELIDGDPCLSELFGIKHRQIPALIVENIESNDWASLTFVGEVHRIDFRLTGGSGAVTAIHVRLDQLLADAEIALPGHIVAEIAVVAVEARGNGIVVKIEALTLED